MGEVTSIRRSAKHPRALKKTYSPGSPYIVERGSDDNGSEDMMSSDIITYEVIDTRPESYRIVAFCHEDPEDRGEAMHDARMIADALNLMVACGKEPKRQSHS